MKELSEEEQARVQAIAERMQRGDASVTNEERDWLAHTFVPDIPFHCYVNALLAAGAWVAMRRSHDVEARCTHELVLYELLDKFARSVCRHFTGEELDALMASVNHLCALADAGETATELQNIPDSTIARLLNSISASLMETAKEMENKPCDTPMDEVSASLDALFNRPLAPEEGEENG